MHQVWLSKWQLQDDLLSMAVQYWVLRDNSKDYVARHANNFTYWNYYKLTVTCPSCRITFMGLNHWKNGSNGKESAILINETFNGKKFWCLANFQLYRTVSLVKISLILLAAMWGNLAMFKCKKDWWFTNDVNWLAVSELQTVGLYKLHLKTHLQCIFNGDLRDYDFLPCK